MASKPKRPVVIKPGERKRLETLASDASKGATAARAILASAAGETDTAIAKRFSVTPAAVRAWRETFFYERVEGLAAIDAHEHPPREESLVRLGARCHRAIEVIRRDPTLRHLVELTIEAERDLPQFEADVAELGHDATIPDSAERLLAAYEAITRRPQPTGLGASHAPSASSEAAQVARIARPRPIAEPTDALVRRVAPDSRQASTEPEIQFPHLAATPDEDE